MFANKNICLLIILIVCRFYPLVGQSNTNAGYVEIISNKSIQKIEQNYKELNLTNPTDMGFRLQIYSEAGANSKNSALNIINQFRQSYAVKTYLVYQQPYYKVLVGDFRNRIEAEKVKNEINSDYPNAFVITDEINLY
ncbi:MAG: SPOR domain-containing protein [Lentimicrobiaceae bacterium]|nr:SPOR domain-containing protein [Lentimicrobiaceae bacterium]